MQSKHRSLQDNSSLSSMTHEENHTHGGCSLQAVAQLTATSGRFDRLYLTVIVVVRQTDADKVITV